MAQTLSGTIQVLFSVTLQQAIGLAAAAQAQALEKLEADFADGSGDHQAHQLWTSAARNLAASASESLEFGSSGNLVDAFGNAIAMTKLKGLLIKADPANTNDVVVGGDTNAIGLFGGATQVMHVKPGGWLLWVAPGAAGLGMTNGSTDTLKVANGSSGTGVNYDIAVLGA